MTSFSNRSFGITFCLIAVLAWTLRLIFPLFLNLNTVDEVYFLDVGQGDSILIHTKQNETILIDSGGPIKNGFEFKQMMIPTVMKLAGPILHHAILTHPDQDHILGFIEMIGKIKIRNLWISSGFKPASQSGFLQNLLFLAHIHNTQLHWVSDKISMGNSLTLFPSSLDENLSPNNRSLITLGNFGGCKMALLGDLESSSEKLWLGKIDTPIDILKLAHHGSNGSSSLSLLGLLAPKMAIASSGRFNDYHHPHPKLVNRLKSENIKVLRTDFHGMIKLTFESLGFFTCQSHSGPCGSYLCRQ